MKPMKSPWCYALDVPRWWSVHGPRLRGIGRNSFAACHGHGPFAQNAIITSEANHRSPRTSAPLGQLGKWQLAFNMHNSDATFPEPPARASIADANLHPRYTMGLISNTPDVTLNGARSLIGNVREYMGVVCAGGSQSDGMMAVLGARVTLLGKQGFINHPLVSTGLTSGFMWGSTVSDIQPITHVLCAIPHLANEQPSELPEEAKNFGNPTAKYFQVGGYQQQPSMAVESGVGTDDAF